MGEVDAVSLILVTVSLGALATLVLGLLMWAFKAAAREVEELGVVPEEPESEEDAMLAQYRARMEEESKAQRARWAGLRKGMQV